ncbi:MAG: type I DNA topoisomerase [Candidatus Paceibacteria bacterium]
MPNSGINLVIVESPTKANTISRFLASDFLVLSSYGHVRDLPKSKLGVDIKNDFKPEYHITPKAKKIIQELKEKIKKAKKVILATDEDREGEAIAWHLLEALGLEDSKSSKVERIVFHEITKPAIEEALKKPRGIDMNLVLAQQARRILDRLVGYELSPFLWKKIKYGLSAGRVQSAALRLIVEREKEIKEFKPQEYWEIEALLETKSKKGFWAKLIGNKGEPQKTFSIKTKSDAEKIADELKTADFTVTKVIKKSVKRRPLPPFTTSTLQQESWRRLRFSSKQTMMMAQNLYEKGIITYMRTDSVNLSEESLISAQKFLKEKFGNDYTLPFPRRFRAKSKLVQEAHEAIRPTNPSKTPETLKGEFEPKTIKLYELIWRRFLASQMPEALLEAITIDIEAKKWLLRANGQKIEFDGFLKLWQTGIAERALPEVSDGEKLKLKEIIPSQHFTQPPPRFSDASLVKALEEYGIGRPSTYAPTISTLLERGYVVRDESKAFCPTSIGILVSELLTKHFPQIVDYDFTAKMEEELDEIAEGKRGWIPVVKEFYEPFQQNLKIKYEEVSRREATERPSEEICEKCGRPMVIKHGRYGDFLACSGYPECSNIKKLPKPTLDIPCPKCGKNYGGRVVLRRIRKNHKIFYGCSRWPECDFASWKKPNNENLSGSKENSTISDS